MFLALFVSFCLIFTTSNLKAGLLNEIGGGNPLGDARKFLEKGTTSLKGLLKGKKTKKNTSNDGIAEGDDAKKDDNDDLSDEGKSEKGAQKVLKSLEGKASALLGTLGGGSLDGLLGGKKDKKSDKSEDKGKDADEGQGEKDPFKKITGTLNNGKVEELLKGVGGKEVLKGSGVGDIQNQAKDLLKSGKSDVKSLTGSVKDKLGGFLSDMKKEETIYSFASDIKEETDEDRQKKENAKLIEIKNAAALKEKHTGDIFYVSLELVRPPMVVYSKEAFDRWYKIEQRGRPSLPHNKGRSARDTNTPFKVVLAPDHAYVVFIDKIFEVLKDQKAGAKAIPVEIMEDHSATHDDDVFWKKLERDGHAYLKDSDGKDQKPVSRFNELKDDFFLGMLDKWIPEIRYARKSPHARVYGYVEMPVAVRLESTMSQYVLSQMAPSIKKRIQLDEDNRNDPRNFDEAVKVIPTLMQLLSQANPTLDKRMANRLRQIINEAFSDGEFTYIKHFEDAIRLLDQPKTFDAINFNNLAGIYKQILVQKVSG